MRSPYNVALTTISLANSMPVAQIQFEDRFPREGPQAAMKISTGTMEEQAADRRENWIPEVAMMQRHGPRLNPALEPVSHHKVIALAKFFDKSTDVAEVVLSSASPINTNFPRAAAIPPINALP